MNDNQPSALSRAWNNIFVRLIVVSILITMLILLARLMMQYNELKEQADLLRVEIDASANKIEALQAQLDAPFNNDYVIKIAKEKLNLSLPQEIIFYNDLNE
ncbi:MAG: septum formation initiator family protein [Clostridia bacterium]|nr:septum formation initiator family protein [Clostridia bacterium]